MHYSVLYNNVQYNVQVREVIEICGICLKINCHHIAINLFLCPHISHNFLYLFFSDKIHEKNEKVVTLNQFIYSLFIDDFDYCLFRFPKAIPILVFWIDSECCQKVLGLSVFDVISLWRTPGQQWWEWKRQHRNQNHKIGPLDDFIIQDTMG